MKYAISIHMCMLYALFPQTVLMYAYTYFSNDIHKGLGEAAPMREPLLQYAVPYVVPLGRALVATRPQLHTYKEYTGCVYT